MRHFKRCALVVGMTSMLLACAATESSTTLLNPTPQTNNQSTLATQTIQSSQVFVAEQGLTIEQIMADPDWIGNAPEQAYWSDDSQQVFYQRKQQGTPLSDLWLKSLSDSSNGQIVTLSEQHNVAYKNRVLSFDKKFSAWVYEGNIFYKNLATGSLKQLTQDSNKAYNLRFLLDGKLSFQSGDSIMVLDPENGFREQRVSWKFADEPKALEAPKDYIAEQQQRLIQVIAKKRADQALRFEQQQQLQKQNSSLTAQAFYLPKGHQTVTARLSPNGQWLLLVEEVENKTRSDNDIMPNYINEDGRIKTDNVRQRVADGKPVEQTLWLLDLAGHKAQQLPYTALPGYNEDVLAAVKRENAVVKGETYQENRLPRTIGLIDDWRWSQSAIQWNSQGDKVAVMVAAFDNKDRWLTTVDIKEQKLLTQHRLHDDAWVNYQFNGFGWLNNSDSLYYLSEETGYGHLYLKSYTGKAKALTKGKFEVDSLTLSADDQFMYFQANKKHPGIYEIYRVNLASGDIEALTDLNGMTEYVLSPDEQSLLLTHSKVTMPPELYVKALAKPVAEQLTHTVSEAFLAINWLAPDIVPIKSSHTDQPIYSRVYATPMTEGEAKRRAVVFTHGAGYLQNSHLGWSAYFREFMFHNFLVQQGYVVLDMDYRASAGYGRDWRTAIYRHMGKPEIEDLRDGVNWLVANTGVDAAKIGTYGGSYGGFMTFMALFTAPDLFQAGAALRPVSDWAHYNYGYTSNILNTPDVDPIAYERSSPIYFAEGLEKPLLINAPMVDNNVFFVDTVRLVQRLIELEKVDFETAIFPVESHGFVQPSSWLDEYRRIYKLFETNL
ncbi:S9 family peptidase [Paraglaciecola hydrolytica]|uniref:Peptidase S9 n=1 Tax=Paraglaciecola hydrolytica TaxID=1799789 RepID=A0A136A6D2_9ALTE|nr:prolyl oligopeptidase family serine peptidase [Paraglaciecola hydrolytica]KXI30792.1 peptidase S9 [Paraglaciecola hydrolytica]